MSSRLEQSAASTLVDQAFQVGVEHALRNQDGLPKQAIVFNYMRAGEESLTAEVVRVGVEQKKAAEYFPAPMLNLSEQIAKYFAADQISLTDIQTRSLEVVDRISANPRQGRFERLTNRVVLKRAQRSFFQAQKELNAIGTIIDEFNHNNTKPFEDRINDDLVLHVGARRSRFTSKGDHEEIKEGIKQLIELLARINKDRAKKVAEDLELSSILQG